MATDVQQAVFDTVKVAKTIQKSYGRTSLTRSAQDTIAMYPAVFSADITTEEATVIAKGLEAQYAALLVSVISANSDFNRKDYPNAAQYLKTFFNNSSIPAILQAAGNEAEIPMVDLVKADIIHAYTLPKMEKYVAPEVVMECWSGSIEPFAMESLNHAYRPAEATQEAMEAVATGLRSTMRPAMEANNMGDLEYALTKGKKGIDRNAQGAPTGKTETSRTTKQVPMTDESGNVVRDQKGRPVLTTKTDVKVVKTSAETGKAAIVRNDRMTNMEPTLINVQLTSHEGDGPAIIHNLVIGVKVMVRCVSSNLMVSNLAEGVMGSRAMFTFIKWTKGQYSFIKDFIFGVNNAKETAISNKDMRHWINALKRRKYNDRVVASVDGTRLPPTTTVVCTTYELNQIQELTGVNLNDAYSAMKLLSKYYFLGFIIYDTANGRLKCIFDGDNAYSELTLNGLRTKLQKENDLTQLTQFMRLAGKS